ncbi:hypothetical protein NQZ68_014072 [Dissostichus eleginoides]|nr:hypothetical protein NQZ68_014072 [Dissostichus eleginoides]
MTSEDNIRYLPPAAMSVSPLPMSELSQQSSRWQQESDAPGLQITEDPDKGGRRVAVGPKGPVVTHSSTPPALPTAMTKISDPVMQTLRGNRSTATAATASASGPEWADRSVNQWLPDNIDPDHMPAFQCCNAASYLPSHRPWCPNICLTPEGDVHM